MCFCQLQIKSKRASHESKFWCCRHLDPKTVRLSLRLRGLPWIDQQGEKSQYKPRVPRFKNTWHKHKHTHKHAHTETPIHTQTQRQSHRYANTQTQTYFLSGKHISCSCYFPGWNHPHRTPSLGGCIIPHLRAPFSQNNHGSH